MKKQNAVKNLAYCINKIQRENEKTLITLTYQLPCQEYAQSRKDLAMYMRKLKQFFRANGKTVKYVAVTHKANGCYHHHIFINQKLCYKMRSIWINGRLDYINELADLLSRGQTEEIAKWLLKDIDGYYISSKNLRFKLGGKNDAHK